MRVATISTSEAILAQIQTLSSRQSRLQQQASTGQRVVNPEDDPAAVGRILNLNTEKSQVTQYVANASHALEVSQATYSGLQQIKSISDRAGELATLGAGATSPDAYQAYAKEVNQLIEQTVQLGNSKLGNDYIFAGTKLGSPPIQTTANGLGQVGTATYVGDVTSTSIQLSDTSSISPGSPTATNQGISTFISNLIQLRDQLATGAPAGIPAIQTSLDASENTLVDGLSEQGAVQLRIQVNQQQQQSRSDSIDKQVSNDANVDLATTVVQLSQTSTAYQAALSSASKILQTSLLDFLK